MPHYKDGTEAKVGDLIKVEPVNGLKIIGKVVSIQANATSCNAQVVPFAKDFGDGAWQPVGSQPYADCITLSDARRLDPVNNVNEAAAA